RGALDRASRRSGRRIGPHRHCARRFCRRKDRLAARHAGDPMVLGQAMIAAGIGCKRGAPASDIEAAIRAALARAQISAGALDAIATIEAKSAEAGMRAVAE